MSDIYKWFRLSIHNQTGMYAACILLPPCKLYWTSSNKKQLGKLDVLIAMERTKILWKYGLSIQLYTMYDCWLNVKAMLGNKKKNNFKYKILELLCILMRCQKACTGDFSENTAAYLPVNTAHNNIICSQKITSEVKSKLNK